MHWIYVIENAVGEVYVGATNNPGRRFMKHRTQLRSGKGINWKLQKSWNTHGEFGHEMRVVACALSIETCHEAEHAVMQSWGHELNLVAKPIRLSKIQRSGRLGKPGRCSMRQAKITAGGRTLTLKQWAAETGISVGALQGRRSRGFTPEQVVGLEPSPKAADLAIRKRADEVRRQARVARRKPPKVEPAPVTVEQIYERLNAVT